MSISEIGRSRRAARRAAPGSSPSCPGVAFPLKFCPDSILAQKHLRLLNRKAGKASALLEGSDQIRSAPTYGRDRHPLDFVRADKANLDDVQQRRIHGLKQWPVAEAAGLIEGHREYNQSPAWA